MSVIELLVAAILLISVLALVGSGIYGLLTFSPERAAAVRLVEARVREPIQERLVGLRRASLIHASRLDRHPVYVLQNIGLHMYGWGVLLAPAANSNLALSSNDQYSLGLCLLTGTSITLAASLLGLHVGWFGIVSSISRNEFADELGDDVRVPYSMGIFGLLATGAAMASYATTIIGTASSRLIGTLGGGLSITTAISCITLGGMFAWRARSYSRERDELIAAAVRRREGL